MSLISIERYENAVVHYIKTEKNGKLWKNMKNSGYGLGVTNIYDLVLKEIKDIYEKRQLTKEEIKNYKMTEREIYKKFVNLSEDELNKMSNKNVYVKNNIMANRGEKKRTRGNRWI